MHHKILLKNPEIRQTAILTKPQVRLRTEPGPVSRYGNYDRYGDPSFRTVDAKSTMTIGLHPTAIVALDRERHTDRQSVVKRRKRDEEAGESTNILTVQFLRNRIRTVETSRAYVDRRFIHSYHFAQLKEASKFLFNYLFIYLWKIGWGRG
jgi:hypothetical protein